MGEALPAVDLGADRTVAPALCAACPAGSYVTTIGASTSTTCTPCPDGSYSPEVAATCTECPEFSLANQAMTACVCDAGYAASGDACVPIDGQPTTASLTINAPASTVTFVAAVQALTPYARSTKP